MKRKIWVLIGAAIIIALGAVYYFADPQSRFMPRCMFHSITGWDCPGCGSQRMIHALLHGDFAAAWHYNAFLMIALPGLVWLTWLEMTYERHPRLYTRVHSLPVVITVCILIVAWTIARNVMGGY